MKFTSNVTKSILDKLKVNLLKMESNPVCIVKEKIRNSIGFDTFTYQPIVSTHDNFDSLLIPLSHVSRSMNDTYYLEEDKLLRTHTSCHQESLIKSGVREALIPGDVYRRDEVDRTHYPVFHQIEGFKLFTSSELDDLRKVYTNNTSNFVTDTNPILDGYEKDDVNIVCMHLRQTLEKVILDLFGSDIEMRWIEAYFPFTTPSFEMEIFYNGKWLEVLGCGVIRKPIVDNSPTPGQLGWAFGIGLERIAMSLFDIPDIRLFWSLDRRFTSQFKPNTISKFKAFTKYPTCYKDLSFWVKEGFSDLDFCQIVREVGGDLVEEVKVQNAAHTRYWRKLIQLLSEFEKNGRKSLCFRVIYGSMERSLTNEEVNKIDEEVRMNIVEKLNVELR